MTDGVVATWHITKADAVYREEDDREFEGSLGVVAVSCGNPACSDGCHKIALTVGLPASDGVVLSYRLDNDAAEEMGNLLIRLAVEQQAKYVKVKQ